MARWIAVSDNHGDKAEPGVLGVVRDFCAVWKPDMRLHLGDCFDFRWLRRSASDEEKAESVAADFEAGLDFLAWYKPTSFLWGNHDTRLHRLLDSTQGSARHLAGQWIDRIDVALRGVRQLPYCKRRGVLRYGDYAFLHGYAHGIGATRKHAITYGNCLFGHIHAVESIRVEGVEPRVGHSIGCLCRLDLDYNAANIGTLRQRHGFAYGEEHDGRLTVWLATETGGLWTLPTETRTYDSSRTPSEPLGMQPATTA